MQDEEYDLCIKKCKSYLERHRIGKIVNAELRRCMESAFLRGYELGKEKNKENE